MNCMVQRDRYTENSPAIWCATAADLRSRDPGFWSTAAVKEKFRGIIYKLNYGSLDA